LGLRQFALLIDVNHSSSAAATGEEGQMQERQGQQIHPCHPKLHSNSTGQIKKEPRITCGVRQQSQGQAVPFYSQKISQSLSISIVVSSR
jgi:hypothetical protein